MGLTCQYWQSKQKMTVNAVLTDTICSQIPKFYFDSLNICHLRGQVTQTFDNLCFCRFKVADSNFWLGPFMFFWGKLPWEGKMYILHLGMEVGGLAANLLNLDNRKAGNTTWKYQVWIVTSSTAYVIYIYILLYYFSLYPESPVISNMAKHFFYVGDVFNISSCTI